MSETSDAEVESSGDSMRVLITGAAGGVGGALWPRLRDAGYQLRLLDLVPVDGVTPDVEMQIGDIQDTEVLAEALCGMDAVVHLAGNAGSGDWPTLLELNLDGTRKLYETAAALGVSKIVFASSCHAAGVYDQELTPIVDPRWLPRPCCKYGWSKAAGEVLGRFFSDHHGLHVINLRIGAMGPWPFGRNGMTFWLSHDDLARAVAAAIETKVPYGTYYAVSANSQRRWNIELGAEEIGYVPQDDAEDFKDVAHLDVEITSCYAAIP